ncbi:membrane protein insertion efficiency factor YidD [Endozoicomonas sp. SM1973]|uniref:Membrane protein insertion efficiency factor YidD n=1 Tax=Spartinivicinus marinus TaxID=2994442 RepID=A0A853I0Z8_9GAMM|nr:membrane protein insertion efficiency factor YidD [Spartinivicinus marinus]MCX4029488.1 membrane protein insertion efficiency factor YidD [Spartinivicinus marinus]NYZ65062.1 membrane protein insertion efficiency factor YidD [Spartinivicinus marinus]
MKWLIIWLIRGYQRWVSPYKGFCCAYATYHHKSRSCSAEAIYLLEQYGVVVGCRKLSQRFEDCRYAYEQLIIKGLTTECAEPNNRRRRRRRKDKEDNKGCDSCDLFDFFDCKPELPCDSLPCDIGPCH